MIYPKEKYVSQYSLKIIDCLDNLGFERVDSFINIKTKNHTVVYLRDDNINWILCMFLVNKELDTRYTIDEIGLMYKKKELIPNTKISDYIDRLLYKSEKFNIENHVDKKFLR